MEWTVTCAGRLDAFLAMQTDKSRASLQMMIKAGRVRLNDRTVRKPAQAVRPGDRIVLRSDSASAKPANSALCGKNLDLTILYEDSRCLVINKPAGIAVHPAPGLKNNEPTILHGIASIFQQKGIPFSSSATLVHRLDKETTGCLLIAKNTESHGALQHQFEDRTVQKKYLAIVAGVPNVLQATIDAHIGRSLTDRTKMSVFRTATSRSAQTSYRTISQSRDCSLLECSLHTGRTHQIRVHLRTVNHPILGDAQYGTAQSESLSRALHVTHMCLHARSLQFTSLVDDQTITVVAPPPAAFITVLVQAGLSTETL